jgi:hypothetical protein
MTNWTHEIDVIVWIVLGTFIAVLVILGILLFRGGRSLETKKVLDAIDQTRTQLGNVDARIEQDHRLHARWFLRVLARFGFLDAQDLAEDIKRRLKDKTDQSTKESDP